MVSNGEKINIADAINIIEEKFEIKKVIETVLSSGRIEPFYILDVEDLKRKYDNWIHKIPRVKPYYAVKCNNTERVLKTFAALGTGFDCASAEEIKMVLALGVKSDDIIFANPIKSTTQIQYACENQVGTTTFDSEGELYRIKSIFPDARLVLRIRCDATVSTWNLGKKFGCDPIKEAPKLLNLAKALCLKVVGVSFHVGILCEDIDIYGKAIYNSRLVFDYAKEMGIELTLLDIGGGFPGDKNISIDATAEIINEALDKYFPDDTIKIISEPGRYFVGSAFTFVCGINAKRENINFTTGEIEEIMYYTNGGVYSAFVGNKLDNIPAKPITVKDYSSENKKSIIWGPTCCSFDQICENYQLPEMETGDWMLFENMGAYTISFAFPFNGFPIPPVISYVNKDVWKEIMQ